MNNGDAFPRRGVFALATALTISLVARPINANPVLRFQVEQQGDFVMFGNSGAWDCGSMPPTPIVPSSKPMSCGMNSADTGPDILWRSDSPGDGLAEASTSIDLNEARTTAVLALPTGASVTYARLYWAAKVASGGADAAVTLERPSLFSEEVTADVSHVSDTTMGMSAQHFYQSSVDVTEIVRANGPGAYRVSGVDAVDPVNRSDEVNFQAWTMIVFYTLDSEPTRNLALFDGLDQVDMGTDADATVSGFLVPTAGFEARLGVVSYEGDASIDGDGMQWNGSTLSDAKNPSDDFFNRSRSYLGAAVTVAGDLPQMSGEPGTYAGVDMDVVDVTALMSPGDMSATIHAQSDGDFFYLGILITSISTLKPSFTDVSKTVADLNGDDVLPGDVLEYTITTSNSGNDAAVDVVLDDALPVGVTYLAGSLSIVAGANSGTKTDDAADDQAEYLAGSRAVRFRLGTGANGASGGRIAIGSGATVRFRVTVDADAFGLIENQGVITANGEKAKMNALPPTTFSSDSEGTGQGRPTATIVDQCSAGGTQCGGDTPVCDTSSHPHTCIAAPDPGPDVALDGGVADAPSDPGTDVVPDAAGVDAATGDGGGDGDAGSDAGDVGDVAVDAADGAVAEVADAVAEATEGAEAAEAPDAGMSDAGDDSASGDVSGDQGMDVGAADAGPGGDAAGDGVITDGGNGDVGADGLGPEVAGDGAPGDAKRDAGTRDRSGNEGAVEHDGYIEGGGCACDTGDPRPGARTSGAAWLLLALLWRGRRERRRENN